MDPLSHELAAQWGVTDVAHRASKASFLLPDRVSLHICFPLRSAEDSPGLLAILSHGKNQGTSVRPAGNSPVIKSGALRSPKKPHLPCRLDRRCHAFSCVPWQLVSTVVPAEDSGFCRWQGSRHSAECLWAQLEAPSLPKQEFCSLPKLALQAPGARRQLKWNQLVNISSWGLAVCIQSTLPPPPVSSASSSTCSKDTKTHSGEHFKTHTYAEPTETTKLQISLLPS